MTTSETIHSTFTLERHYAAPPAAVFAAWADPAVKARWFAGGGGEHELDFRVGGRERVLGRHDGKVLTFEARYQDIVQGERIVSSSTLSSDDTLSTVSITTVEFVPDGDGTRLVLTEQGTYLDGHEQPAWREQGTASQLDALTAELDALTAELDATRTAG
ncbi:SRPBCC domain-containing protein [Micromonospora costi]|uniref:Polyketide cyclase n=1 Tax=Micromonospora costi TaxID=1530042 RepID=A0A3A9ZIT3_9ACTN|nr:SRPBCC domain-containing protein [Micromonospora costi]RKN48169.1 polyketide cyclase [Micromonospora costi]